MVHGISNQNRFTLAGGVIAYSLYAGAYLGYSLLTSLPTKSGARRLFSEQKAFIGLFLSGSALLILFIISQFVEFNDQIIYLFASVFGIFQVEISYRRLPMQDMSVSYHRFSMVLYFMTQACFATAGVWNVFAIFDDSKWIGTVSDGCAAGFCMFYVATELNTFIASQRLLSNNSLNSNNKDVHNRILSHLGRGNLICCILGCYVAIYYTTDYFTALVVSFFLGAESIKAYGKVFRLCQEMKTLSHLVR